MKNKGGTKMKNRTRLKICGFAILIVGATIAFKNPYQCILLTIIGAVILNTTYKMD